MVLLLSTSFVCFLKEKHKANKYYFIFIFILFENVLEKAFFLSMKAILLFIFVCVVSASQEDIVDRVANLTDLVF